MTLRDVIEGALVAVPALPALGALALAVLLIRKAPTHEPIVARLATLSLAGAFVAALVAVGGFLVGGAEPVDAHLGPWFDAGGYGLDLVLLLDGPSAAVTALVALLLLATCRFSIRYLHREPGFVRFFAIVLIFAAGMQTVVLSGSFDVLLAGWEVVGLSSVLLVGFFHERTGPIRAAVRVLVTYRLCDVGLLLATLELHHTTHSSVFREVLPPTAGLPVGAVALGIVLAAMGKSAQFPVGGWLPRAMEGPTASSAVFYGGLSVHAGVFLLIRSEPLIAASGAAQLALIGIGLLTAATSALNAQAAADAKTSLAYATASQVGLMLVEVGLGLPRLALLHLIAHALLRYFQFLRTPSTLADALARRSASLAPEEGILSGTAAGDLTVFPRLYRFLYRLALERFEVEAALERFVVRPALRLSGSLDGLERRALAALSRGERLALARVRLHLAQRRLRGKKRQEVAAQPSAPDELS